MVLSVKFFFTLARCHLVKKLQTSDFLQILPKSNTKDLSTLIFENETTFYSVFQMNHIRTTASVAKFKTALHS